MNPLNDTKYFFSKTVEMGIQPAINAIKYNLDQIGFRLITEIEQKGTIDNTYQITSKIHRLVYDCSSLNQFKAGNDSPIMPPCNVIINRLDDNHSSINIVDPRVYMENDQQVKIYKGIKSLCTTLNNTLDNIEIGILNEGSFYQ